MTADDDGFVSSANKTVRNICASEDDLQRLIDKGYLIPFPEESVFVITHFLQQNQIRLDRYHKTIYTDQMNQLTITENKMYIKVEGNDLKRPTRSQRKKAKNNTSSQDSNRMTPNRQPDDTQMATHRQTDGTPVQSCSGECSTDDDDMNAVEAEINEAFQQEIGRKPLPGELSNISAMANLMKFSPGVANFAIELAAKSGANNVTAYVRKILTEWDQYGIKTLSDAHAAYYSGRLKPKKPDKNYDLPE